MPEQKSVFDHSAQYHSNGADVLVYKALVPIPCYRCNQNIMPGDLFRRSASKNGKPLAFDMFSVGSVSLLKRDQSF
jgi:tRNA U34 2-thiouridine synthase MnmA/TrmU